MKNSIRLRSTLFCTLLFAGIALSRPSPAGAQGKLVLTGTGSAIGVMQLMGKAFQQRYPDTVVEVLPSIGSTGGIKAVGVGKIDVGLSARSMKPEEMTRVIVEEPYGRTAFIFATQESASDKGFTLREFEEIFAGKRTAWRDGKPVRLVLRPMSDAYSQYLVTISNGMKAAYEKAHAIPGVFVGNTDQEAAVQIEKTQGAFGVTSACLVAAEKKRIKGLSVDGVAPTMANVASGAYPYTITMHIVYRKDSANPAVKQFADFVFSTQGRKILTQTQHVPLKRGSVR